MIKQSLYPVIINSNSLARQSKYYQNMYIEFLRCYYPCTAIIYSTNKQSFYPADIYANSLAQKSRYYQNMYTEFVYCYYLYYTVIII